MTRNPAAAAAWYESVLGAAETSRITLPGDQILTIELGLGDSTLALSDEFPDLGIVSPRRSAGPTGRCTVAVPDADAAWQRALDARRHRVRAAARRLLGVRTGQFIDPFGHRWAVDQHLGRTA